MKDVLKSILDLKPVWQYLDFPPRNYPFVSTATIPRIHLENRVKVSAKKETNQIAWLIRQETATVFPRTSDTHLDLHSCSSSTHGQHHKKDNTEHSHFQMMQDASRFRGVFLLWSLYLCSASYKALGPIIEWFINKDNCQVEESKGGKGTDSDWSEINKGWCVVSALDPLFQFITTAY